MSNFSKQSCSNNSNGSDGSEDRRPQEQESHQATKRPQELSLFLKNASPLLQLVSTRIDAQNLLKTKLPGSEPPQTEPIKPSSSAFEDTSSPLKIYDTECLMKEGYNVEDHVKKEKKLEKSPSKDLPQDPEPNHEPEDKIYYTECLMKEGYNVEDHVKKENKLEKSPSKDLPQDPEPNHEPEDKVVRSKVFHCKFRCRKDYIRLKLYLEKTPDLLKRISPCYAWGDGRLECVFKLTKKKSPNVIEFGVWKRSTKFLHNTEGAPAKSMERSLSANCLSMRLKWILRDSLVEEPISERSETSSKWDQEEIPTQAEIQRGVDEIPNQKSFPESKKRKYLQVFGAHYFEETFEVEEEEEAPVVIVEERLEFVSHQLVIIKEKPVVNNCIKQEEVDSMEGKKPVEMKKENSSVSGAKKRVIGVARKPASVQEERRAVIQEGKAKVIPKSSISGDNGGQAKAIPKSSISGDNRGQAKVRLKKVKLTKKDDKPSSPSLFQNILAKSKFYFEKFQCHFFGRKS